jgi:radical SAM protein with 4Fe4S-binding SPASM domain
MPDFNSLDLKLGFSCNNDCLFCAQGFRKRAENKTAKTIKEELSKNAEEYHEVVLTGGEPTIRNDIFELVAFAKKKGYQVIKLQSNGRSFHDLPFCRKIIDSGANAFSISIHGPTAEIHDFLTTKKGSFNQTKEGIKNLIELGQYVATNTVITKQNYRHLPDIAKMLSNLYPDQSQFAFIHPMGSAEKNIDIVMPKMSNVIEYLKLAIDILKESGIEPRAEAIPPCMLLGYEKYTTEQYINVKKIVDLGYCIDDWSFVRKTQSKKKFKQCKDCCYFLTCEGPWKEYPEKMGSSEFKPVLPVPNEIIIELTKKCNLDCDFCFNDSFLENQEKMSQLSKYEIFKVIDESAGNANAIRFTGGEPLLRGDLPEILGYAKKKKIYTILNTNGFLFNEKNFFILNYLDEVLISFHNLKESANKAELFKKIRGYNLRGYNRKVILRCCTTLTRENIINLEKFYSFMEFQPVDDWFFLRQIPNSKSKKPISKEQAGPLIDKIINLNKNYRFKPVIANAIPFCVNDTEKTSSIAAGARNDSGHTRLVIGSYGNILPDYFSGKILGSIRKNSPAKIKEIWLSSYMKDIRNLEYLPDKCRRCSHKTTCKAGLSNPAYIDYLIPF